MPLAAVFSGAFRLEISQEIQNFEHIAKVRAGSLFATIYYRQPNISSG